MKTDMILYIEDDEGTAKLVRSHMERYGYFLEVADSAESGIKKYDKNIHKAILMDYILPGMSGVDALKKLSPNKLDPTIIMLTAAGSEKVAVEAINNGAAGYVIKDNSGGFLELLPIALESALRKKQLYKTNAVLQQTQNNIAKELAKLEKELNRSSPSSPIIQKILEDVKKLAG